MSGAGINTSPCLGTGGMMNMGPGIGGAQSITDQMTPTYQASLTWVKDNHTFKFGSEVREFGYPLLSLAAANGVICLRRRSDLAAVHPIVRPLAAKRWDSPTPVSCWAW